MIKPNRTYLWKTSPKYGRIKVLKVIGGIVFYTYIESSNEEMNGKEFHYNKMAFKAGTELCDPFADILDLIEEVS